MADSSPNARAAHRNDGGSIYAELPPHAYDPQTNPELFEGVLARRVVAFIIDLIIIVLPLVVAAIFIFFLGLITFGLGRAMFWLLSPASIIWALFYYGMTLILILLENRCLYLCRGTNSVPVRPVVKRYLTNVKSAFTSSRDDRKLQAQGSSSVLRG